MQADLSVQRPQGLCCLRGDFCIDPWCWPRPPCTAAPSRGAWASTATPFASGWMQLRGARRRLGVDRGFVLSDHADWPGLQRTIPATGAQRVIVTHGFEAAMVRWLQQQGLQAGSFATECGAADPACTGLRCAARAAPARVRRAAAAAAVPRCRRCCARGRPGSPAGAPVPAWACSRPARCSAR